MGRGDLDTAGAERGVHQHGVGDDRDPPAGQGQVDHLAQQVLVAGIVRVHGHGGVAEHRLGPGGGDVEDLAGAGDRVLDGPEVPLDLLVIDLIVGHRGAELGVPVDQPLAAENLAGLEQVEERPANRARADLVKREAGAVPVARAAHEPELAEDSLLVLVLPRPDPLD